MCWRLYPFIINVYVGCFDLRNLDMMARAARTAFWRLCSLSIGLYVRSWEALGQGQGERGGRVGGASLPDRCGL